MEKFRIQYKLLFVNKIKNKDRDFYIELAPQVENNYGHYYALEDNFDSPEEALMYVEKNSQWKYRDFTILPVYSLKYNCTDEL